MRSLPGPSGSHWSGRFAAGLGSSGRAVVRVWFLNRTITSLSLRPTFIKVRPLSGSNGYRR